MVWIQDEINLAFCFNDPMVVAMLVGPSCSSSDFFADGEATGESSTS
jgi:diaminopimelate decarboxylase